MSDTKITNDGIMFFARAPGQVAEQTPSGASIYRGARSGNSNFDPASGRFAAKNRPAANNAPVNPVATNPEGLPQGVTPEEWYRRRDTVRAAARSMEDLTPDAIASFLQSNVRDLSRVDVQAFVNDVRMQRLDDLTDVLSQQLDRGRNIVSLRTTRSWARNAMAGMTDEELVVVLKRLQGRGYSERDINKKIVSKIADKGRRSRVEQTFGEAELSLDMNWTLPPEFDSLDMDDDDVDIKALATVFADAVKNIPAPVVNVPAPVVTVQVPQSAVRKVVHRDENNRITSVEELPVND